MVSGCIEVYPKPHWLDTNIPEMNRSRPVHKPRYQVLYPTSKIRKKWSDLGEMLICPLLFTTGSTPLIDA